MRLPWLLAVAGLVVFAFASRGFAGSRFQTIYHFGAYPGAETPQGLIAGPNGAMYGVSTSGGLYGYGTVFELQPPSAPGGAWTETVLYSFAPQNGDGLEPLTAPSLGPDGAIYGMTAPFGPPLSTVYQVRPPGPGVTAPPGGTWTENVIYRSPYYNNLLFFTNWVAAGPDGNLYGVSSNAVFELTPPPTGSLPGTPWSQTIITTSYSYLQGLALGAHGVLYILASQGIPFDGAIISLKPPATPSGSWTETTLYTFGDNSGGLNALQPPVTGPDGAIYGTTSEAGANGLGTVFQLLPPKTKGGAWTYNILYNFGGTLNQIASSPLVVRNGKIYGTAAGDYAVGSGGGYVFELEKPSSGSGLWNATILYNFTGKQEPNGGLVVAKDGALYGTTVPGPDTFFPPAGDSIAYKILP